MIIEGVLSKGEGSACSTIPLQKRFLAAYNIQGTDTFFDGTLNINISPHEIKILVPDVETNEIEWEPGTKEVFQMIYCEIMHKDIKQKAVLYYPMPSPIKAHPDSILELLTSEMKNLKIGDSVTVIIPDGKVAFK